MTYVREFSAAGPCITLGKLIRRTAKTVWVEERDGSISKRSGYRVETGLIHTEPCLSCRDHRHTQYPNGYMD